MTDEVKNDAADKAALRRDGELADLRHVLASEPGRRAFRRVLERCNVFGQSFVPTDWHQTAFNEGKRNVGCWLLGELTAADPAVVTSMMEEKRKDDLKYE